MKYFFDVISTAALSLWTRKLRTFLSILGITIGVLTVSALLTVALGVRDQVQETIGTLGANFVGVTPGNIQGGGGFASQLGASTLTERDFESIRSGVPEAKNLSMASLVSGAVEAESKSLSSAIILGGSPGTADVMNLKLKEGRFPDQDDEESKAKVAVIGDNVREELLPDGSPLGETIRIRREEFEVIGVLEKVSSAGGLGGPDTNSVILMPLQTGWELGDSRQIFRIFMQAPDERSVLDVKSKVKSILFQNHGGEEDFSVLTQDDILETVGQILDLVTAMLGAIAAISLIVGGIGIMNTMLVAVSERTREIGIRKAVGATRKAILTQFLIESVMMTLLGGLIAVLIFSAIIFAVGSRSPIPLSWDFRVIGGAILFSVIVGVVFGSFPAYQASRKDPIVALRYE